MYVEKLFVSSPEVVSLADAHLLSHKVFGQLPIERITPDSVFSKVDVDYAGPVYIKHGHVRKPVVVKAYICVPLCEGCAFGIDF